MNKGQMLTGCERNVVQLTKWSESDVMRQYKSMAHENKSQYKDASKCALFIFALYAMLMLFLFATAYKSGLEHNYLKLIAFECIMAALGLTVIAGIAAYCTYRYISLERWIKRKKAALMHRPRMMLSEERFISEDDIESFNEAFNTDIQNNILGMYSCADLADAVQRVVRSNTGTIRRDNSTIEVRDFIIPQEMVECWALVYGDRIGANIVVYVDDRWGII